jgi:hypothetical protein
MARDYECIFPESPKDCGGVFIIKYGWEDKMVTDSTVNAAEATFQSYLQNLTPEQLAANGLTKSMITHPGFVQGAVQMTRILGTHDASRAYYAAWDADPHFREEQAAELEAHFNL